jgi:type I restriction enzyme S subunit
MGYRHLRGWRDSTWGDEVTLEYGKGLRDYADGNGPYRVLGQMAL